MVSPRAYLLFLTFNFSPVKAYINLSTHTISSFSHIISPSNLSSFARNKTKQQKKSTFGLYKCFLFNQKHTISRRSSNDDIDVDENISKETSLQTHAHHHVAIKTRNIENSIMFYSLLGFHVEAKFRSGPARAAWLNTNTTETNSNTRLELIEVPAHILQEEEGTRQRAIDLMKESHISLLGLNHFALDVTEFIQFKFPESTSSSTSTSPDSLTIQYQLQNFIEYLNQSSQALFGKTLRVALQPQKQRIGNHIYELAFLYDADGSLVELLYQTNTIQDFISDNIESNDDMESGWIPWDGKGFQKS